MPLCKNKLWLENFPELLCNLNVIPLQGMSLESQMNALTRLVIGVFLILLCLDFKHSILFLLLSLLFIIILYYIQRHNMEQFRIEKYTPRNTRGSTQKTNIYCGEDELLSNQRHSRLHRNLTGKANPKTLIAPHLAPRTTDLDYWRASNLTTHSSINDSRHVDTHASGYESSNNCAGSIEEPYKNPQDRMQVKMTEKQNTLDKMEHYSGLYHGNGVILENQSGQVNTAHGYNPEQLFTSGLPSNYLASNCEKDEAFKQHHTNLFTQTVTPGVYSTHEIIEPFNDNIGISHTQQLNPTTVHHANGSVYFKEHDPRIFKAPEQEEQEEQITRNDIYDPRFTGYGTSYRSYYDKNSGTTKFYYDDIDAITMPNYITRSKIDFAKYADSYGPKKANEEMGNRNNHLIRQMANKSFLDSTILHRTEIMERQTRKNRKRAWQQRMMPIY